MAAKGRPAGFPGSLLTAEGLGATPQPKIWRLVFDEPAARGGVREIEVSHEGIVAERTPSKNPFPQAGRINLSRMQLDSEGAFTAAENEALRRKIGFDAVNYLLQAADPAGTPVWQVQLLNKQDRVLATLFINGSTGRLTGMESSRGGAVAVDEEESTELKIHRTLKKTGESIVDGVRHVGGSLEEVFTGERTIDKKTGGE